jgi:hypothetical protein
MRSKLKKITLCGVLALSSVGAPGLASAPACLVGETIVVGEGYHPLLSGNGEVVVYDCDRNFICITDYSTTPPTEERIAPDDPATQGLTGYSISNDGQRVVYSRPTSSSNSILALYDRTTGQTSTLLADTSLISEQVISGNGLYVVFLAHDEAFTRNGLPGTHDNNGEQDVVRYTIASGEMEVVSVSSAGAQGNAASGDTHFNSRGFDVSDDGNIVVFQSAASNLVVNDDNDYNDVFLRDISAGVTRRVSLSSTGQELWYGAHFPRVSGDGSVTTFSSRNLNYTAEPHLFAYDISSGSVSRVAPTIDRNDTDFPTLTRTESDLSMSEDGRFVYFQSKLDNLVEGSPVRDYYAEHFVYDRENGATRSLDYASIAPVQCTPTFPGASKAIDSASAGDKVVQWAIVEEGQPGVIVLSTLPDTNPPWVELTSSPTQPTALSHIQFLGAQIDDVAASDVAQYSIDGGAWQPFPGATQSSQWAALYEDGFAASSLGLTRNHQVCMRAYDARGNVGSTCEELEILPESPVADSIIVQCLHEPIWPQPGETVTVTATAFPFDPVEGLTLFDHGDDLQESVDSLEIWVNDNSQPVFTSPGNASSISYSFTATGNYATYGCRIHQSAEVAFSGWKLFGIGDYPLNRAIPIQKSSFPERAIDIVFIADEDDYSAASDPDFLEDVHGLLKYGYLNHTDFLKDQHRYNFWVARDMGNAKRGTLFNDEKCAHRLPSSPLGQVSPGIRIEDIWLRYYQFADTAAIVHTEQFRDCAPYGRNVFSVGVEEAYIPFDDSDNFIVRHETGHRPFGLSDEYCCDGGYSQTDRFPNIYEEREDCEADVVSLGRVPEDCREFIEENFFDTDWYISDPPTDDLMDDNGMLRANDKRRFDWFYRKCSKGEC